MHRLCAQYGKAAAGMAALLSMHEQRLLVGAHPQGCGGLVLVSSLETKWYGAAQCKIKLLTLIRQMHEGRE